jgi:hypothetical protein
MGFTEEELETLKEIYGMFDKDIQGELKGQIYLYVSIGLRSLLVTDTLI